jgi:hypothetical protein
MRKLFLPFLFFVAACTNKQPDKKIENTDYIISMDGVEGIKLGMSQAEIPKTIGKKISLISLTDILGVLSKVVDYKKQLY